MKTRNFVVALAAVVGMFAFTASSHAATVLFSTGTPDENRSDFTGTVGTRFETGANSLTVTALGFEDTGFGTSHQVGLWTDTGTLLVSTTVAGTDTLMGQWRFALLKRLVVLLPNTVYRLGGEVINGGDPFTDDDAVGSDGTINFGLNAPLTVMGTAINEFSVGGFSFPGTLSPGSPFRWAPANALFTVEGGAEIPEPSTFVLAFIGLLGLGLCTWRRRRRA